MPSFWPTQSISAISIAALPAHSPGTRLKTSAMILANCIGSAVSSSSRTLSTAFCALAASSWLAHPIHQRDIDRRLARPFAGHAFEDLGHDLGELHRVGGEQQLAKI